MVEQHHDCDIRDEPSCGETISLEDLTFDPDDPNYKNQEDVMAAYEEYSKLPAGWTRQKEQGKPPFVHEDGRASWKHPGRIQEAVRSAQKEERKRLAAANKKSSGVSNADSKLVQRFRKMLKNGVPKAAVESQARRDGLDPAVLHSGNESVEEETRDTQDLEQDETAENRLFRATENGTQIEFLADLNKSGKGTHIATLVRKMVQTIRKRGGVPNVGSRGSYLTVDHRDLYNALGAFRGVQRARNMYNSACNDLLTNESEVRAKRKPFLEHLNSLGIRPPQERHETADIEGLDELIGVIEKYHQEQTSTIQDTINVGMYDFDSLSELYKPGDRAIAKNAFASGVDMMCEVSWSRYEEGKTLFGISRYFKVCFQFVVAVGEHFTICEFVEGMESFNGRRSTLSLPFVPLGAYNAETAKSLQKTFAERGQMYSRCATGSHFLAYTKGSFYAKGGSGGNQTAALRTNGRVMIDTQGAYDAGHSLSIGYDPILVGIKYKYKEYMLHMRRLKQTTGGTNGGNSSSADAGDDNMILFETVPEDYLEMTWPASVGFSFTSKIWGDILIDGLSEIQFQESVFDSLVLPPARKRMIKALVRHSSDTFSDIVSGKGEGSVFLLYGPPGVGKTLTAEAISEMLHRPLYSVSLGQLGTTPSELETKLGEILDLCGKWDALILLDEADIFLEKRTSGGSLERNAMVSVMLRLVEYFKGVLFLTSNRVDSLDPAFKTRITLALRYVPLDFDGRNQVWKNLLAASGLGDATHSTIDTKALAQHKLNGREIKNALRLSMALAKEDNKEVSQEVILETVEILCDFNEKMNTADAY